jgi:hypothetical protein
MPNSKIAILPPIPMPVTCSSAVIEKKKGGKFVIRVVDTGMYVWVDRATTMLNDNASHQG